jgi:hypothetical protein
MADKTMESVGHTPPPRDHARKSFVSCNVITWKALVSSVMLVFLDPCTPVDFSLASQQRCVNVRTI